MASPQALMVLSSCAVRQCLETGGICFGSFSKHAALKCGNCSVLGLPSFPPAITGNTYLGNGQRVERDWIQSGLYVPISAGIKKLNRNTFLLHLSQWLNLQSSELNYLVVFGVEIWLNYSETRLHKGYISEQVLEVKCILPCTQDSIKGQK